MNSHGMGLKVENLGKYFPAPEGRIDVLRGLSFDLEKGERIAVVGRSGAGKSTLLHIIGTLDHPSSGHVLYDGENILGRRSGTLAKFRNSSLGFIFQFHHLLPEFTALENVMMPVILARKPHQDARKQAREILGLVGLDNRMEHKPGELSGGERQRVAVARAMVMNPKILLADEPTGNLDGRTGDEIHDLLITLNEERNMSMIIVTHNLDLAKRMTRQIRLFHGQAMEEKPGQVVKSEMSRVVEQL